MRASLELGVWTILCCCLFDISQAQRNETSQNVSEPFITSPTVAQTTVAETSTFQTTVAETSTFQTTVAETSTFQTTVAETSTFQTNVAETSTFQTNVAETSTFTPPLTTSVEETVTSSAAAGTTESGTSEPSLTDQISDLTIKNMSVSKVTTWSITVSWSKPEGHSSFYIVQWTDRNTSMMDNVTETSTVIANLTAGVEYSITVTAVAADNRTIGEGTDVTVYTKPQVVKNMSVSEVTTWSITVSWSKPEGHSSFYMVQWTDRNTSMMDNVTETSTVIANLTAGVEYSITVTAVAADNRTIGEGTDVTVYTKPQVVKNMSVSKVTTWSITVSWSKPEGHSSFYMVQWTDRNTSMMDNVTETSTVIANLTAGVEYSITVTAVAADNRTIGEGTDVTVYTKPQVVKNMSVSKVTTWSITVSWSKPEGHSSFYMVQWTDRNTSMMDNVTETSTVIANLTAGVEYSITVTAVAADNRTIGEGTDVTVYTKPQVVKNMSVSEVTTWSITVSWSKPEGHSSFYIVQWTDRNTSMMDNVTETSTVIANLTAGVEYSITVTAVAADNRTIGEGTDVTVHTKPQVVKNMSVSEVTTWSITVSWSKPEGHSSFYMVQWTDRNTSMMDNVTETSTVIANLTAGVEYSITVTAVAADNRTIGEGTDVTVYTKPQVVKNMSVSEVTTWSITVSWSKPEGHSSFYIVQWTDRNTSMMDNVTETSTVIANLTAGVEYSITVAAVAADNRTIGEGISQASYTRPGKIEEIRVSPGLHELDFDWDKPEGRLLTFKAVLDHKDGNVTTEYSETAKVRFHKLTPGTHYALSVTPIAGDNKTEGKSTMLSTVTQPAKPENISAGNRGTDHLNISWTLPEGDADFFVVWYDERDAQTRASPQLITGLSPGRLHNVSVAAVAGHLNNTSELFTFATHPLPPKSVRVVSRTNSSMDLSWDLSPEMLGAPNIEYSVHWGGDSGRSTPDNNMTLTSLDSGKMYEIVVETIGPEKLRSSAINIRDCTKPNPVLDLRASPESNTSVKVEWAPPDYDDSYSYRIKIYKLLGPVIEEILEEKHSTVVTGLEPGTRYHISVISIFTSECTSSEVTVVSYTKPSPVSGLTALLENTTAVTLTWFSSDEYEPPCSYSVQAQASTGEVHEDSTPTQSYTFTGLTPGEAYTFTVITKVAGVQSDPEAISRQLSPAAVTLLDAAWGTTRSNVSWSVADGWVDVYAVRLYDGTPALAGEKNVSNSTLSTSFTDLAPGAVYCVKVVTVRGLLENESPDSCNFTFPNPPRNISVASRTEHSLTFVWDSPEDMSPPQDFMITTDAGVHQTRNLTWTLSGLESGSPYGISVSTVGINDSMSRVVTEQAYTKPYPVTQLRQTQINPDSVALAWNQTEHKQDYTFFVEVRNISGDVESLTVTVRSHEAKGLTSGTNYSFTVTTRTADGTAASAQTVSHFTRPYPVEALAAVAINSTALSLTWGQPVEYKAEYTYLIETSGCGEPKNQTTPDESEEISDLTPGTNCSACVYVRAANLIQGEQQCTHQYTEPERVRPRLSSRGANSSLLVSWAKPPGNVELYNIYLNGTQRNESFVHFNSSDGFYTLENLSAGRLYAVVVETQSGPHKIPSESVANATFPNPPGAITISSKTTDTIHIWWEKAPLMSEGEFLYRLEIPSKPVDNTTLTSHVFQNLESGTSYNVSVTSVGPMGFESETVRLNMVTTKPFGVRSLEARPTEGSVDLNWTEPRDHKDTYRFSVSLGNTSGTISQNETRQMEFTFKELDPGSSYYISVTTETLDGTQAAPERTSICTDASAVEFSECVAPNEKNATITWFWDKPKGRFSNFTLKFDDPTEKEVIDNYQFKKSNLKHFAKYSLEVATQSCGKPSAFVKKVCQTGITEPPVPNNSSSMLSVEDKKYNGFTVNIDPSLLNPDHGPIKNVGVVMAKRDKDVEISKMAQYLETSFQQWVKQDEAGAYLTNVINVSHSEVRGRTCRALEPLAIPVGDKSVWKGYANGLLEANTKYKYAIVLFTDLEEKGELINAQISVFAPTQFDNFVQTSQNPVLSLAVGLGLAIFFMLLVVLIGLIVFWRRSSDKKSAESENNAIGAKVSVPVPVEDYEVYYKKQKADSNCGFAAEYEDIKVVGSAQSRINAQNPENKSKNRYNNVLPYDSSRVKLSIINGNPLDDYINANYIPGYNSRKEFIAAQGPLPTTVNEFWRMIWEKNVHTLVMLTRCNEQGRLGGSTPGPSQTELASRCIIHIDRTTRGEYYIFIGYNQRGRGLVIGLVKHSAVTSKTQVKCEQYWTSGTKHFGNITVTTTSEIPLEDWTIRDFDVKNVKTAETRSVRHFHFTAFPDHGVPETTEVLISFRHLVREHMDQYRHSPTVVHCSAGVGRTGTFIAIDRLIFQIERENVVDVFGIVYDMRMHRTLMVQTESQYVFLNQCALDIIRSRTGTNVDLIYQNTTALSIYENIELQRR